VDALPARLGLRVARARRGEAARQPQLRPDRHPLPALHRGERGLAAHVHPRPAAAGPRAPALRQLLHLEQQEAGLVAGAGVAQHGAGEAHRRFAGRGLGPEPQRGARVFQAGHRGRRRAEADGGAAERRGRPARRRAEREQERGGSQRQQEARRARAQAGAAPGPEGQGRRQQQQRTSHGGRG
jgi:hypothetical protein